MRTTARRLADTAHIIRDSWRGVLLAVIGGAAALLITEAAGDSDDADHALAGLTGDEAAAHGDVGGRRLWCGHHEHLGVRQQLTRIKYLATSIP